jgi:thioesterase domain-containing protein
LFHSLLDPRNGIDTIEDMVARYLPHMNRIASDGPVRLAGYCHGGLAALEAARRLEKAGRTVESVVLIDTLSLNARPAMRTLVGLVNRAAAWTPGRLGDRLRRNGGTALWRLAIHLLARDSAVGKRLARTVWTGRLDFSDDSQRSLYYRAMARYVPPRLQAEIVSLVCDEYAAKKEYAAAAWLHVSPKLRAERIRGGHGTCITRHVDELAACLDRLSVPGNLTEREPVRQPAL